MRQRRDPVPRARAAGHWLGGILLLGILGGAVVVAAILLWENLDVRQLAPTLAVAPGPLPEPEPPVGAGLQEGGFQAVLLNSPRNGAFFPDESHYPRTLARWRRLMEAMGAEVREVGSEGEMGTLALQELLVVPGAPCLSQGEVAAITAHLESGGGVVSNWAVGARDEACEWRGWETVAQLTGAGDVRELAPREGLFMAVPGGLPLSPGLDPGARIELRPEPTLALNIPGPRVFWSDWALNPAPDESGGGADVAATATETDGGGRVAWFGFQLSQAATPRDSLRLDRLVRNGIAWAAGLATASPSTWPQSARAALLLVEDVEAEYQNAVAMAEILREEALPGTFFVVSQLVMDDPGLAGALSAVGEVGSQTSDHTPLAGLTYEDQLIRLRRSWTEIRDWAGVQPGGLRPPEETFDRNTLRAWAEVGGRYVLAVNQARSGGPEIHEVSGEQLVLLPRLLKDDYNVIVQEGARGNDHLAGAFLEGTAKLRALGGLAIVGVHTQIARTGHRLDAIRTVADTVRAQGDWWIARAGDVADWWRKRAAVRVSVLQAVRPPGMNETEEVRDTAALELGASFPPSSALGLDVLVEGPADEGLVGLWVDVVLPGRGEEDVRPFVEGHPVSFASTDWGIRVSVGDLGPGETRRISLRPTPGEVSGQGGE